VDIKGADHAPDEARCACLSRPWDRRAEPKKKWNDELPALLRPKTFDEMLEDYDVELGDDEQGR
jgi:hypothetical protein